MKHYQEAAASWFSIQAITKNVVGGIAFGATIYLGGSLVNALTFQKISTDLTEAIINGKNLKELSNLSLQEYSKETLSYFVSASFSTFINYYFFSGANEDLNEMEIFADAFDCSVIPSLINLAGTALSKG